MTSQIVSERVFDVPTPQLYAQFSNPERLAKWWGPAGFTNTISTFELFAGGNWNVIMHGPDGTQYPNVKKFVQVEPGRCVVFDHISELHAFRMTISWHELPDAHTRMRWVMDFREALAPDFAAYISQANDQNFDRLVALLHAPETV